MDDGNGGLVLIAGANGPTGTPLHRASAARRALALPQPHAGPWLYWLGVVSLHAPAAGTGGWRRSGVLACKPFARALIEAAGGALS